MTAELDVDPLASIELPEPTARTTGRAAIRRQRAEQRKKRFRRRVLVVVAVVWTGLLIYSFLATLGASRRANDAVGSLAARGLATTEADELREVAADLETARSRLSDPWVRPLELVPLLGRQIRAARTIDESALEAVSAGADAIEVLNLARDSGDQVALLTLARSELATARERLAATVLPSSTLLIPPLTNARNRLGDQLVEIDEELRRFHTIADAFGSLLESEGRYLLAAANTSEMGAGTGMMLSLGLLEFSGGSVSVGDLESFSDLDRPSGVSVPAEIRDRWFSLDPGHLWQYTALLTPRIEEVGRISADMWESVGREKVDGVLIVNPVALELLLRAGGAEMVDIGGEDYPVETVGRFFGRLQYQLYPDTAERRGLLAPVARDAFSALFENIDDPQRLVDAVHDAAQGRHLMAWARDPEQQERWENLGVAGRLRGDSLLIGALNAGGNKLDAFLEISSEVSWVSSDAGVTVSAQIEVSNTATGTEVEYIAGSGRRGFEASEYSGYLTVNLPAGATRAQMTGTSDTNAAGPDGPTHQLVHILRLMPGESASYRLEFDLPAVIRTLTIEPSGRLPAIAWRVNGVDVPDRRRTFDLL